MMKYFQPASVTWWAGVGAIVHGATTVAAGDFKTGASLILGGLFAIGVRGAIFKVMEAVQGAAPVSQNAQP